jgi:predicted site-specific integrase-resolvase
VCAVLNVSAQSLRSWAKGGKLHPITLPSGRLRYRTEEIRALIEGAPEPSRVG